MTISYDSESVQTRMLQTAGGCLVIVALLCIPTIKACGGLNVPYSEGSRSGVVQKISKKGFVWKTWEGELNLGYVTSHGEGKFAPALFYFSVTDDDVVEQLQKAERTGDRVTLEYKEVLLQGYSRGATGYDVTGVITEDTKKDGK